MSTKAVPITAIISWSAREGPDVPSAHHYRGSINMSNGEVIHDQPIGRPGKELWETDQLVYPLAIGERIHGDEIGGVYQWDYNESPVLEECPAVPAGGTPTGSGGPAGSEGTPIHGGTVTAGRISLSSGRASLAMRLMLETNETERAALRTFLGIGATP